MRYNGVFVCDDVCGEATLVLLYHHTLIITHHHPSTPPPQEDVTPFARDGWDAAIHQQQSLEQHPQGQHVQHDTTTEEQQVLSGRGIRAAGSVTRGGGSGVQWEDTQRKDPQRKHVAGGVGVHDQTRGKGMWVFLEVVCVGRDGRYAGST